jgi:hypothetical protein
MAWIALVLSAAMISVAGASAADTGMVRKAGEWESTMINPAFNNGAPSPPRKICFGSDKSISDLSDNPMMKNCTVNVSNVTATGVVVDASCQAPNIGKVTTHTVISRVGDDAYHAVNTARYEGAPAGAPPEVTFTIDSHRLGPCQPGETPH